GWLLRGRFLLRRLGLVLRKFEHRRLCGALGGRLHGGRGLGHLRRRRRVHVLAPQGKLRRLQVPLDRGGLPPPPPPLPSSFPGPASSPFLFSLGSASG